MYWFQSPGAVALDIFGFDVRFYSIMLFLGIVAGMTVSLLIAKKRYNIQNTDILLDFFPVMVLVSILFARLYYVLLCGDYYIKYPGEIFAIWHGGISIHGAIIGGLLSGIVYFKYIKKTLVLMYADVIAYGLCIGQAIGRWGNFFNSEAFGTPTNLLWKIYILPRYRPVEYLNYEYFHPTFLYESLWNILIFLVLFFVAGKFFKDKYGTVFFSYLILYSIGRFLIEGIRTDSVLNVGNIPIAQLVSVVVIIVSLCALIIICKNNKISPLKPNS